MKEKQTSNSYYMKYNISPQEYYGYLRKVNSFSFLQEPIWTEVKSGDKRFLIGLYYDNQIVGVATALIVKLFAGFTVLYIARGPVLDFENAELLQAFRDGITKLTKENHALFAKMDPHVINEKIALQDISNYRNHFDATISTLKKAGFRHQGSGADRFYQAWQIQVHKAIPLFDKNTGELFSEATFLPAFIQNMPKRMKHIFLNSFHEKRGVSFKLIKGPHSMDDFAEIMKATEKRKNIFIRNKEYFERIAETFGDRAHFYYASINIDKYIEFQESRTGTDADIKDAAKKIDRAIEKAEKYGKDIVIGACLVIMPYEYAEMKIAEYLFAGGNNFFPDVNCSRGLIYRGCIDAIQLGCHFFDLGGTPTDPNEPLTVFKNTFYPDTFEFIGEFDLITNKVMYNIYENVRNLRNQLRAKRASSVREH